MRIFWGSLLFFAQVDFDNSGVICEISITLNYVGIYRNKREKFCDLANMVKCMINLHKPKQIRQLYYSNNYDLAKTFKSS